MFIIRFQFRFCVRVFMYSKIHKQANKNGGNLYFAFYICIFLNSVIISDRWWSYTIGLHTTVTHDFLQQTVGNSISIKHWRNFSK